MDVVCSDQILKKSVFKTLHRNSRKCFKQRASFRMHTEGKLYLKDVYKPDNFGVFTVALFLSSAAIASFNENVFATKPVNKDSINKTKSGFFLEKIQKRIHLLFSNLLLDNYGIQDRRNYEFHSSLLVFLTQLNGDQIFSGKSKKNRKYILFIYKVILGSLKNTLYMQI